MNKIIAKKNISEDLVKFEIRTSIAVAEIQPGRYVLLTLEKNDPGIPVAVLKTDAEKETISVLVYVTDNFTRQLAERNSGNELFAISGPFGYPVKIESFGTVLCVVRGPGIVMLLPILTSLHRAGNRIITILSAETKEGIILENEVKTVSDEVITITDDGSYGEKGTVCQSMIQTLRTCKINQVIAIGSATTIKIASTHSTKYNIPIQAVLYLKKTNQYDRHGIYKVSICGSARAVCVDGFNFNSWYPNLEEMTKRFGRDEEIPCKMSVANEENIPV